LPMRPAVEAMSKTVRETIGRKRRSRVPVGEYLVIDELLRRGFGAQLTGSRERILLVQADDGQPKSVRVKTTHGMPWYLRRSTFIRNRVGEVTIFVLLGSEDRERTARFFVTSKGDLATVLRESPTDEAFVSIDAKSLDEYENNWDVLKIVPNQREEGS
jgi:hypothetical protein